jgi:hypothetical protein
VSAWAGYDAWLEAPYADQVEPPECNICGGPMTLEEEADEDGPYLMTWCDDCEETA